MTETKTETGTVRNLPSIHSKPLTRVALLLALTVWLFSGSVMQRKDLELYALQHAGVEAIVERGTFDLSATQTPKFKKLGDTFSYEGRKLPQKYPGQFLLGAIPYTLLNELGTSYSSDYILSALVVTWGTTGLCLALGTAAFFWLLIRVFRLPHLHAFIIAIGYGCGTNLIAYSSVPHHDVIATNFIMFAVFFAERARLATQEIAPRSFLATALCGICLGFALSCSLLTIFVVAGFLCYFISIFIKNHTNIFALLLGVLIGFTPFLLYHYYFFGNPLLATHLAGSIEDTYPALNFIRFLQHFNLYFGLGGLSMARFEPLAFLGLVAFFISASVSPMYRRALGAAIIGHILYLCCMDTVGHCQYGPRYLMPLLPIALLGVAHLIIALPARRFPLVTTIVWVFSLYGVLLNVAGALGGSLYCSPRHFAGFAYVLGLLETAPFSARLGSFSQSTAMLSAITLLFLLHSIALSKRPT
jgi:hypothetical protein